MPIIDQGYQHWSGQLSSHAWRWLAITRRGLKTALQGRFVRMALLMAWSPALLLAVVLCLWGLVERQSELVETFKPALTGLLGRPVLTGPRDYRVDIWTLSFHYFLTCELWFAMLLILLVGPNLISQDLRYNALPLYFSRPLRRIDYFLGKLGVIVALLGMIIVAPAIVAYLLGLLFSLDITILRDTLPILLGSVVYGLVISISAGLLILAFSSISRNSRYVSLMWIGFCLIATIVSTVLTEVDRHQRMHEMGAQFRNWSNAAFLAGEMEAAKTNWRPVISYISNLRRIEEALLHTNASWARLGELSGGQREPIVMQMLYSQFPWYWSAAVLLLLAALSAWILTLNIKSLDRLK
ncbi:MAG TPA: hypothetical protein VHU84_09345 [Lacipirellulaceae bacterium]|jgi:ABC-2 type transport system permease protein|nr:hypothetical protein [Lacipirellulaceae bacterium]